MVTKQIIYELDDKVRLDKYLVSVLSDLSRSEIQNLIRKNLVLVNGENVKSSYILSGGEEIIITFLPPEPSVIKPQNIPLDIIYEDRDIIVVNKKSGMVVHPGSGNKENTLVNALLYHCDDLSGINGIYRAGIVHRIDKNTSGVLVACKNDKTHRHLAKQFSDRTVKRIYQLLVHGVIPHNLGRINAPIARNPHNRQEMDIVDGGKEAITNFRVLERFNDYTLVEADLETGRTHQIRVHFKYIGYPVVGDLVYGPKRITSKHQLLHAETLGFIHPKKNKEMKFKAPLPDYFNEFITNLKKE